MVRENPIIKELLCLDLPTKHFAIFGSGIMFALGIKNLDNGIDIIARGPAWKKAISLGKVEKAGLSGKEKVVLFEGRIEIFNDWVGGNWNTGKLIDFATMIEGIPFVNLDTVLKWKKMMGRDKDLMHIKMIENYISKNCVSKIY